MFYQLSGTGITNTLFEITAAAAGNGSVTPDGALTNSIGSSQMFTGTPDANYLLEGWYVDGELAQDGGTIFTLSNIQNDHHVVANFVPSNDISLVAYGP